MDTHQVTSLAAFVLMYMIVTVHAFSAQNDSLQTELYRSMRHALHQMCPDSCDLNTTKPSNSPNVMLGSIDVVSCCEGCFCHENCHENTDCCFPDDDKPTHPDVSKNMFTECMYVQTGSPELDWISTVPAYHIVTYPPADGCKPNVMCPVLTDKRISGNCNDDMLTTWGALFPVYSTERKEIYKTELCACCHGVVNYVPWQPYLVCDEIMVKRRKQKTVTEQILIIESDFNVSNCYITFRYNDPTLLLDKLCYLNTTSTCEYQDTFPMPTLSNLSREDIVEACTGGLNSPIATLEKVYKNVFCSVCNQKTEILQQLKCDISHLDSAMRFGNPKFTYVLRLDLDFFQAKHRSDGKVEISKYPKACSQNILPKLTKGCRTILCPSGQIRDHQGDCKFPVTEWNVDSFVLYLKLKYTTKGKTINTMLLQEDITPQELADKLLESSPWPTYWTINSIWHDVSENHSDNYMLLELVCKIKVPTVLYNDIIRAIHRPLNFNLKGLSYRCEQKILEYVKFRTLDKIGFYPKWFVHDDVTSLQIIPPGQAIQKWTQLFRKRITIRAAYLNKLFVCEQVELQNGEYILKADNDILISNLSVRTLFDAEFELVSDQNGILSARMCFLDTLFISEQNSSNENTMGFIVSVVFVLFALELGFDLLKYEYG